MEWRWALHTTFLVYCMFCCIVRVDTVVYEQNNLFRNYWPQYGRGASSSQYGRTFQPYRRASFLGNPMAPLLSSKPWLLNLPTGREEPKQSVVAVNKFLPQRNWKYQRYVSASQQRRTLDHKTEVRKGKPPKIVASSRICHPGPPKKSNPRYKNCLIIGDSISLGYSPIVFSLLAGMCQVQHAPFSKGSGAMDSRYGFQCLPIMLRTTALEKTHYDAVVFNFGLHDINHSGRFPEEYVPLQEYKANLEKIKSYLLSIATSIAFVLTTPVPSSTILNNKVLLYNQVAKSVMYSGKEVAVIDLYTTIVDHCGHPPYIYCSLMRKPKDVHFNRKGYRILGNRVAAGFKRLLAQADAQFWGQLPVYGGDDGVHLAYNTSYCADKMTRCPHGTTCCPSRFSLTGFGCCMIPDAVPCADKWHCCQKGFSCFKGCTAMKCYCLSNSRTQNSPETSSFSSYIQSFANASHFREMLEDSTNHITPAAKYNSPENVTKDGKNVTKDGKNDATLHHASFLFNLHNGESSNGSSHAHACLEKNRSVPCESLEQQTMKELLTIIQARHKHKVTKNVLRNEVLKLYDSIYRNKNETSNRRITELPHVKRLKNTKHVSTNESKAKVRNVATGHKSRTRTSFVSMLTNGKPKKTKTFPHKIKLQKANQVLRKGWKGSTFVRYGTKGVSMLNPSKRKQKTFSKSNKNHSFFINGKKRKKETDNDKKRLQKVKNKINFLSVNTNSTLSEAKKNQSKTLKDVLLNDISNVDKLNQVQLVKEENGQSENHPQRNVSCNTESNNHSMNIHKDIETTKCRPYANLRTHFTSSILEKTKLLSAGEIMSVFNSTKQRNTQRINVENVNVTVRNNGSLMNHTNEKNFLKIHMHGSKINMQSLVKENITKNKQILTNDKEKLTHENEDGMSRHDEYVQGAVTNVTAQNNTHSYGTESYSADGHETGIQGTNDFFIGRYDMNHHVIGRHGTNENSTATNSTYLPVTKIYDTNGNETGRQGTNDNRTVKNFTAENSISSGDTESYDKSGHVTERHGTNTHVKRRHGTDGNGTVRNVTAKNNIDFDGKANGETFKESFNSMNDARLERQYYILGKSRDKESETKQVLAESLLEGEDASGEKRQKTVNSYLHYNNISERKSKSRLSPAKFYGNLTSTVYSGEGSVSEMERGLLTSLIGNMESGSANYFDNVINKKNQFFVNKGFIDDDLMKESSTISVFDAEPQSLSSNGNKFGKKSKLSRNRGVYVKESTKRKDSDTNLRNHKNSHSPNHVTNFKLYQYKEPFTKQPESFISEHEANESDVTLSSTTFQKITKPKASLWASTESIISSPYILTRKQTSDTNGDGSSVPDQINSDDFEESGNTLIRMDFGKSNRKKSSRRNFVRNFSNGLTKKKQISTKKKIKNNSRNMLEKVQNSRKINDIISGLSELDFTSADADIMQYASTDEDDGSTRSD